jgi:hypothetical protein
MFDNYLKCLKELVLGFGESRGWSPKQLNKSFIVLFGPTDE